MNDQPTGFTFTDPDGTFLRLSYEETLEVRDELRSAGDDLSPALAAMLAQVEEFIA